MCRPTSVRQATTDHDHGADGHGIGVELWLSLPFWIVLALIAILVRTWTF